MKRWDCTPSLNYEVLAHIMRGPDPMATITVPAMPKKPTPKRTETWK